jgi:hypothetical protein
VARPPTEVTKKDKEGVKAKTAFTWTEAAGSAFATLKRLFTEAPILVHFHHKLQYFATTKVLRADLDITC